MVKKKSIQEVSIAGPVAIEQAGTTSRLRDLLEEIRSYEGVIGYILRNSASAAIDLKDPTKIIDYAILSSVTLDSATEISGLFDLGEAKSIIVQGKNVKMLCLAIDEDRISVLMNREANCDKILSKLTA